MKTVQLLYSYLLVEKPFSLESQPSAPTKEKRFAYNLYLDMIYLMDMVAHEVTGKNKSRPLATTRFVLKTESDDHIKTLKAKYSETVFPFRSVIGNLSEQIKESLLFREFEKNRDAGNVTDKFWEEVFTSIIMADTSVNVIIKNLKGYSLSGVDRMKTMMEVTFKNFYSSKDNIDDALKTLEMSMQKARDLYMRLLALPVELTRARLNQLELNKRKFLAAAEDLNPNMKFVNNRLAALIEKNETFDNYTEKFHLSWQGEDPELVELLLKDILESEIYKNYLDTPESSLRQDVEFWHNVMVEIILNNQAFLEYLENKSVFWNDDLEIMTSFVLKTFKRFESEETKDTAVMPMYKDGADGKDAKFGSELFRYVVVNKEIYKKYIEDILSRDKWEADRLAFMDVVVVMTALAEIINYPEIPLNVSINEYIEIAKSYSSVKSGQFVHGLLASLVAKLKEDGVINK